MQAHTARQRCIGVSSSTCSNTNPTQSTLAKHFIINVKLPQPQHTPVPSPSPVHRVFQQPSRPLTSICLNPICTLQHEAWLYPAKLCLPFAPACLWAGRAHAPQALTPPAADLPGQRHCKPSQGTSAHCRKGQSSKTQEPHVLPPTMHQIACGSTKDWHQGRRQFTSMWSDQYHADRIQQLKPNVTALHASGPDSAYATVHCSNMSHPPLSKGPNRRPHPSSPIYTPDTVPGAPPPHAHTVVPAATVQAAVSHAQAGHRPNVPPQMLPRQ
jgi:hypothetical protein